jgi:HEAT repeat protein
VREAIGSALMRCANSDSALALAPFLGADQASLRNEARELLHALPGAERVAEVLLTAADPDVRMFAVEILAQRKGSSGAPRISQLLTTEHDINVLAHAVEQLGIVGTEEYDAGLAALKQRLPDEEFLGFAIDDARERIAGRHSRIRGAAERDD